MFMSRKEQFALMFLLTLAQTSTANAHMPHVEPWKNVTAVSVAGVAAFVIPFLLRKRVNNGFVMLVIGVLTFIILSAGGLFFSFVSSF
jgi:hypothetical protein